MAADFDKPELNASTCSFELKLPSIDLSFTLPSFTLIIPPIPIPMLAFELSCDLSKPISVTAGIKPGGGRNATYDPDPDDEDT